MKYSPAIISLLLGLASTAGASVTLGFNDAGSGGIATKLANGSGVITDGMNWGIIIDTGNDGFAGGGTSYNAYAAGVTTSGFLTYNGVVTNDYFLAGGVTVDGTGQGYTDSFGREPTHGTILDDIGGGAPFNYTNGMAANESFALVWFGTKTGGIYTSNAGDTYGFLTDASFKLPIDGSSGAEFGAPWNVASIPTSTASNTFASLAPVPEPSRVLLLGLGGLGLVARRRRRTV